MLKILVRSWIIALLATTISCQPTSAPLDIGDGGILSSEPCGPPCLWNIMPGVTTQAQALQNLQDHFDLQICSNSKSSPEAQWIVCKPIFIKIDSNGIVEQIAFTPTRSIRIEQVITAYGQPNQIDIGGDGPGGFNTPVTYVWATLDFESIHTQISLDQQDGQVYDIAPSAPIIKIEYFATSDTSNWTYAKDGTAPQPWKGFGKYQGPIWAGP